MIEEFFVSLAIIGTLIASITDIKERIVPNKLTFPLIGIGFFGHFLYSIKLQDFSIFFNMLHGVLTIFIVGYVLYLLGNFPAADVKEFMFIAALIPQYPEILKNIFTPTLAYYPFIITIFVNSFFSIFPFLILYGITKVKDWDLEITKNLKNYLYTSLTIGGAIAVSEFSGVNILFFVALFALYKVKMNYRIILSTLLIVLAYTTAGISFINYIFITFLFVTILNLFWNFLKILRGSFQKNIRISDLKEGMVIGEEVYIEGEKIVRNKKSLIEKITEAIKTGDLNVLRKKSIVSTSAAGLYQNEIDLLKNYVAQGKIEDRILIKDTIPMSPIIALGLIISLTFGDVALAVQGWIYG